MELHSGNAVKLYVTLWLNLRQNLWSFSFTAPTGYY